MTSLSVLRRPCLQLLRSGQQLSGCQSLASPALVRMTHTSNVDQGQKSSIPARAESHGYTPFKVDFKENKVEWALARVDDLVNWGRKVLDILMKTNLLKFLFMSYTVYFILENSYATIKFYLTNFLFRAHFGHLHLVLHVVLSRWCTLQLRDTIWTGN